MNKKICIFTWCYCNGPINFGQILQCYALQHICKLMGYDTTVIRYRTLDKNEKLESVPPKGIDRDIYESNYKNRVIENQSTIQAIKTNDFIRKNIALSEQCYCIDDVLEEIKDKDILIVGSDQLWNPLWIDTMYLLDFDTKGKRCISYATSGIFNESIKCQSDICDIVEKIEKFDFVSVREPISKEIIEKYTDRNIFNALDPVLMLNEKECDEISCDYMITEPYILAFFIGKIDPQKHLLKQVAKIHDIKKIVYVRMAAYEEKFCELDGMIGLRDVGPGEFISLIKNATAVCTDSFHAFVLSVIYHKVFYLMNRAFIPLSEVSNDRWDSIMNKLGIGNRYSNSRKEIIELSEIEYEDVEKKLEELRNESRKWLIQAIGE